MKMALLISLLYVLGLPHALDSYLEPLSDEQIEHINSVQSSWKAGRNFHPNQLCYAKSLLGVDMELTVTKYIRLPLRQPENDINMDDLPTNFDPRDQWPQCTTIKEIRDQGECGSCWAFGTTEAISDRICVATNQNVNISAEDVLACCETCGSCGGGAASDAWAWYVSNGIVSGGLYDSDEGCLPYTLPPCDHHCSGQLRNCSSQTRPTPECTQKCVEGYNLTYTQDKHYGNTSYGIQGIDQIMNELYTHGPVTASFVVYEDFLSYRSGVYKHTTDQVVGGHAIKILGWGVEDGLDYWLCANSWNEDWGDKGFFKIIKGIDEGAIEDLVVAGMPKV